MDAKHSTSLRDREVNVLQRHWKTLKRDVRMSDIVDPLIEEGVLKPTEWEDLKRRNNSEKDRTEDFLHFLMRKSSKDFYIFLEALKDNGFQHIANKLDVKPKQKRKDEHSRDESDQPVATEQHLPYQQNNNAVQAVSMTADMMKIVNDLKERDDKREKDQSAFKLEQEERAKKLEKSLMKNLRNTNEEVSKLKDTLHKKELEIDKLKKKQTEQEQLNKDLKYENTKIMMEREKTQTELKISQYNVDEMHLQVRKEKMEKENMKKEKQKLAQKLERQNTLLQEREEQLEREHTDLETTRMEKDELHTKIRQLEDENERLSLWRPQTALSSFSDDTIYQRTQFSRRPSPTGRSIVDNTGRKSLTSSDRYEDRIVEIEVLKTQILEKQKEQDELKKSLQVLQKTKSIEKTRSEVCVVQ